MNEVMRIKDSGMDYAVRQIGDSWSLLILWSALQGTTRFDNFQSRLGVARNILSNRLSKLVEEGILVKRPVRAGARRLEYRITGKGEALRPALELIDGWGNGGSVNGAPVNGTSVDGTSVDGTSVDGTSVDGASVNVAGH